MLYCVSFHAPFMCASGLKHTIPKSRILAIMALEQLFGIYDLVKEYEDFYKEKDKRKKVRKQATDIGEIVTIATTQKQVKENKKEIERLEQELAELTNKEDSDIAAQDTANLDKAAEIKGQITVLKRKRTRLISQLNAVKENESDGGKNAYQL